MNFNLFSLFKKNSSELYVPDSILVKRVKSLAHNSDLKVFSNIDIYLHRQSYNIELLLYDYKRGLYIFEIKKWSFDDLKNATIQKAQNQEHSNNTLAFDKTQEIIKRKFNEITHTDGPKIYNYLLMENLSAEEYEHLDDSFKELLPEEKIIFSDSQTSDIFKKIESEAQVTQKDNTYELETLLTQYTKIQDDGTFTLCSDQEKTFLDTKLDETTNLATNFHDGKTSLLILKAIIELFEENAKKVIILKPTILARDIAYKKLLEIIEHGIIEFDMNAIEFLTPLELINKHLQKLKKPVVHEIAALDLKLMNKSFNAADLIICDDANLLNKSFIEYIKNIQKNKKLLFINLTDEEHCLLNSQNCKIHFIETYPLAKTMHLLQKLLLNYEAQDIMVVSNEENKEKLKEDLEFFLHENTTDIESSKTLLEHNLEDVKLATYNDIFELSAKYVILLDLCDYNEKQIEYALNLATLGAYILYDQTCDTIDKLKEKYESNKE
ncbi:hypothetical protein [Sulfurimonas sp. C5]|uniref:hypothetical protein n=1 Tax=Sulfurimonas sp. C5 TaxID=3036947 RepID=UPI0024551276|nr:hypothetical protein [Sulfurimonas sp. C5]MDH4945180.1 hypothetical protein [Sulfurimonas sp. C5]